jgi:hypothetical protein
MRTLTPSRISRSAAYSVDELATAMSYSVRSAVRSSRLIAAR